MSIPENLTAMEQSPTVARGNNQANVAEAAAETTKVGITLVVVEGVDMALLDKSAGTTPDPVAGMVVLRMVVI